MTEKNRDISTEDLDLALAMTELDDDLIADAITYKPRRMPAGMAKWVALAACLCVLVVATGIVLSGMLSGDSGTVSDFTIAGTGSSSMVYALPIGDYAELELTIANDTEETMLITPCQTGSNKPIADAFELAQGTSTMTISLFDVYQTGGYSFYLIIQGDS